MIRWFTIGSLAVAIIACGQTPGDGGGGGGSTGATGGTGAPTGGAGMGPAGGATQGGSGGSGAGTTGGSAGTSTSGTGGSGVGGSDGGTGGSGVGGTAGMGTGGAGVTGGSGGSGPMTSCTYMVNSSVSSMIPTVGIVTWSSDLAGITAARIEFGRDTTYGMTAPVDLEEPMYRTLLLGMKASTEYHYRIVATGAAGECVGPDNTIMTGAVANGLPRVTVRTMNAAALYGGFLITGQYQGNAGAYILDADGDYVWWFNTGSDVTGARMSYDGKYMWINRANVPESQGARVNRVSMDGMMNEDLSSQFVGQNHQLTVLPDETVAFYAYGDNGCDDVKERSPAGMVRTIVNSQDAHGATGACHLNAIEYSPEDDTLVFSDLDHNSYTKVRRSDGETVWVLGGPTSDFTGMGATWSRQHGIDVLGLDRFVIFNNGGMGAGGGSLAIEILLDLGAMTASRAWEYAAMPSIANQIMGDVQRLENGNTIVAYSTQGVLHEVSASGELLQELEWPSGGAYGYIQKRPTLYGPPPR